MLRPATRLLAVFVLGAGTAAATARPVPPAAVELGAERLDVRTFDEHLVTLASPFMEGRLPGTRGFELASEYVEYWFEEYGLVPPFPSVETIERDGELVEINVENASWRQPFDLGGQVTISGESLVFGTGDDQVEFKVGEDFEVSGMGGGIDLTAPMVFVGYSIEEGPDGYASYPEDVDLEGKIAVMLRFEPMDEDGKGLWGSERRPWSNRASFNGKLRGVRNRNAAAAIIINPPGADDPRAEGIPSAGRGGRGEGMSVLMMSPEAGEKLISAADPKGRSLMELRRLVDEAGVVIDLDGELTAKATVAREPVITSNVGALLPGKGSLADEYIVIGGHLDHLGDGEFGSRSGPGKLHPGADDNASGTAGVIMLAQKLKQSYDDLPEDADARSILFLAFSAEESGLNGSRHYAQNPLVPIENHMLMINFDMIGRLENDRLSVSGMNTGEGLKDFVQPYFEKSKLEVVQPERMNGASDHTSFVRQGVPILFGICADFHADYHTPEDVSWKINRLGAARTVRLFHQIALGAAQRSTGFEFIEPAPRSRGRGGAVAAGGGDADAAVAAGAPAEIKVRVGIVPGEDEDGEPGVVVTAVTEDTAASEAGLQVGDRIVMWNKDKVTTLLEWIGMLAAHEPGDEVQAEVVRDGVEIRVALKLRAK